MSMQLSVKISLFFMRAGAWRPCGKGHGDRKGRHYYTTYMTDISCMVVATLAVAMLPIAMPYWAITLLFYYMIAMLRLS